MRFATGRAFVGVVGILAVASAGCSSSSHRAQPPASTTTATSATTPTSTTVAAHLPALRCPASPPERAPSHQVPGTTAALVPGRPAELLGCRYHGFNQPQRIGTLAASARFAPGPVAALLNAAAVVPPGALYNCPADFGERIVLRFGYANGATLTVLVPTAGCLFASNGDRTVQAASVLAPLEARLGHDIM